MIDDVHGRHGQTGPIYQARDISVEGDVVEVVLRCLDFLGVLFVEVPQRLNILVAIHRIRIEAHLRIESRHAPIRGTDHGVDFHHIRILLPEHLVKLVDQVRAGACLLAFEAQLKGDAARLVRLQADRWIDARLEDLLGRFFRNLLDLNPSFGRGHDHRGRSRPIHENRQIVLLVDIGAFSKVNRLYLPARRTRLHRNQRVVEHSVRVFERLFAGLGQLDASLETVGEASLATAARMDLRFNDDHTFAEAVDAGLEFVFRAGRRAFRTRNAVLFEQLFSLVFVNIHGGP